MRVAAARSGKRDYQVVEEALRAYLGLELLEKVGARSSLARLRRWTSRMRNCIRGAHRTGGFRSRRVDRRFDLRRGGAESVAAALVSGRFRAGGLTGAAGRTRARVVATQVSDVRDRAGDPCVRGFAAPACNNRAGPTPCRWPHADPGDDYLVVLARASGAQTLVSGDRHLYDLVDPVPPVLLPRAFSVVSRRNQRRFVSPMVTSGP